MTNRKEKKKIIREALDYALVSVCQSVLPADGSAKTPPHTHTHARVSEAACVCFCVPVSMAFEDVEARNQPKLEAEAKEGGGT